MSQTPGVPPAAALPGTAPRPAMLAALFLLACLLAFPLVLALGMNKGLSHDEHQHVAAGALIAREGLRPYKDFPYFHTPYLAYLYALLFRFSDRLLLAARLFSVGCATAIAALTGTAAFALFCARSPRRAWLAFAGALLLCLFAPVFTQATGRAWNQEPALLFALLAFFAHVLALARGGRGWLVASGALLGLAIGTRLTYAPLMAPFGLALIFLTTPRGIRLAPICWFSLGLLLGLAGVLVFFARYPEQAWFANFEFAHVNVVYRMSSGEPRTMTLLKKLRYLVKLIIRPNFGLFTAALVPVLAAVAGRFREKRALRPELLFILLVLPFLLIGSFAPSPLFPQYFYPFAPFLILTCLYALASLPPQAVSLKAASVTVAACVVLTVGLGLKEYRAIKRPFSAGEWTPNKLHQRGVDDFANVPPGPILTLAPLFPLEAGRAIYPGFATGPFAWRIAPYLPPAKAARLGFPTPLTLAALLTAHPPGAILDGFGEIGEEELSGYATAHRFRPVQLGKGDRLWINDQRDASTTRR